jgi:hypothetical protein
MISNVERGKRLQQIWRSRWYGSTHLAKRDPPLSRLVPKHHAHALDALKERKPSDGGKLRVIP